MASGFIDRTGLDFDDRFIKGKGTQEFGLTAMSGVDVGVVYLKGNSGVSTGYLDQKGTDIGFLLGDNAFTIRRSGRMEVSGDRDRAEAEAAGWSFLEANDFKSDKYVDCAANENICMGGSYKRTYYMCFRIHCALQDPNLKITVNFKYLSGGSAKILCSEIRQVTPQTTEFVVNAGGGDNNKRGSSEVTMIMEIPGLVKKQCYIFFWNDTD